MPVLMLILAIEIPEALSKWKISYAPAAALVRDGGESLLFHNAEVYYYDKEGNLIRNFKLTMVPREAFMGNGDSVWLHDGQALLGFLNANHNMQWQREMPPPSLAPLPFGDYLVYANENRVFVLEPEDGSTRFSLRLDHAAAPMKVHDGMILIADSGGDVVAWDPLAEIEQTIYSSKDRLLQYLAVSEEGAWALAYGGGKLKVLRENRHLRWKRDFRIEISVPPLWLSPDDREQLVVATHGRTLLAYGPRGEQLARKLLQGRPKALIPWDDETCLLVPERVNRLIWYHAREHTFGVEEIGSYQTLVASRGDFVLMVANDGIIRLYRK